MSAPTDNPVQTEFVAIALGLYPALIVALSAALVGWTSTGPMHTISLMLLVAGAYSAFRAFRMRHRQFDHVADTKAIGYWIYGTSVALVAMLASSTLRSSLLVLLSTIVVMIVVIRKRLFPVVTSANVRPGDRPTSP